MKRLLKSCLVCFAVICFAGVFLGIDALADSHSEYPAGPIQKAERGFQNTVFGWTEIPKKVVDDTKATNPVVGVLVGTVKGTFKAFARTASGVADLVTFPIGGYEDPAVLPDMPAAN